MKTTTKTNLILGSRIALAMAMANGSPVHSRFARTAESSGTREKKTPDGSQATKKRKPKLTGEVKPQDRELAWEVARMDEAMAVLIPRR